MRKNSIQIIYQSEESNPNQVSWLWKDEAEAFKNAGMSVGTIADPNKEKLIYRGGRSVVKQKYEQDIRFINEYVHFEQYSYMSKYFNCIADLTIETFFVNELNDSVKKEMTARGWNKAFIRNDEKSLEFIDLNKCFLPTTSLAEIWSL